MSSNGYHLNTALPSVRYVPQLPSLDDARIRVALDAVKLELQDVRQTLNDTQSITNDVKSLQSALTDVQANRQSGHVTLPQVREEINGALQRHLAPVIEQLGTTCSTLSAAVAGATSAQSAAEGRATKLITTRLATVTTAQNAHSEALASLETCFSAQIERLEADMHKKLRTLQETYATSLSQIRDQIKSQVQTLESRLLERVLLLERDSAAAHRRAEARIEHVAHTATSHQSTLATGLESLNSHATAHSFEISQLLQRQSRLADKIDAVQRDLTQTDTATSFSNGGQRQRADPAVEQADHITRHVAPNLMSSTSETSAISANSSSSAKQAEVKTGENCDSGPDAPPSDATATTSTTYVRRMFAKKSGIGPESAISYPAVTSGAAVTQSVTAHSGHTPDVAPHHSRTSRKTIAKRSNKRRISVSGLSSDDEEAWRWPSRATYGQSQPARQAPPAQQEKEQTAPVAHSSTCGGKGQDGATRDTSAARFDPRGPLQEAQWARNVSLTGGDDTLHVPAGDSRAVASRTYICSSGEPDTVER